jgi:hypothetical protein
MRRLLVPMAVIGLAMTAGCGDKEGGKDAAGAGAQATAPGGASAGGAVDAKKQKVENLIADCMKKQGFQYVPHVLADLVPESASYAGQLSVLEPADEVRKFREKYGFGVMSRLVYPDDPAVKLPDIDPSKNPNNAIRDRLDAGRREAYDRALDGVVDPGTDGKHHKGDIKVPGCSSTAYTEVFGDTTPDEASQRARERAYTAFQTDPEVVADAQKWADCLRGQGYKVNYTRPGEIETGMATLAMDGQLPAEPGESVQVPTGGAATAAVAGSAPLSAEAAKVGLQRETKAALADLDCRTDYATLVRSKYAKVLRDGDGKG